MVLPVEKVQVADGLPHRVRPQPGPQHRPLLQKRSGGAVEGEAAAGRGVGRVEDGQDAVEHRVRQQGQAHQGHHDAQRDELGVPQDHKHHRRQGQAHPAGAGVGHGHGHAAGAHAQQAQQTAQPALGTQQVGHRHRDQQQQDLAKGVGVIKEAHHAPRHVPVHVDIHVGEIDLYALDALVDAVEGHDEQGQRGEAQQALQLLPALHGADQDHHAQHAGDIVQQKAEGQGGVGRQGPGGKGHACKGHEPGPDKFQVQPEAGLAHPGKPGHDKAQGEPGKAVSVVPALKGQRQKQHHDPGHSQGRLLHHGKGDAANTLCSKTSWPTLYSFCSRIVGMLMRNVSTRHSTLSGQARVSTPSRERTPTTALL